MHITTTTKTGQDASAAISLDVYSASYNASAFAGSSSSRPKSKPKGAHVGTLDQGPFATWASMMDAVVRPGMNDLSIKGDKEKMQDKEASATATATTTNTSAELAYFGTVGVNPGEYGVTVNSEACPQERSNGMLEFLFEIPSTDGRNASVAFLGRREAGAGVYLLANC